MESEETELREVESTMVVTRDWYGWTLWNSSYWFPYWDKRSLQKEVYILAVSLGEQSKMAGK